MLPRVREGLGCPGLRIDIFLMGTEGEQGEKIYPEILSCVNFFWDSIKNFFIPVRVEF